MKGLATLFPLAVLTWLLLHLGPSPGPSPQQRPADLESVLKKMDALAATFRSAQAEFEWDRYEKVIDEVDDFQSGTIYYRRSGKSVEMMADVKKVGTSLSEMKPEPKYVLFSEGKIQLYQPKIDQVTVYDLGKNSADFESYLVLGFGGSGQELMKAFDVTYVGPENVQGVDAAKLQLIPKSQRVRNSFKQIFLWIDPQRGISVQQQFFEPQGNYRLAKYSQIKLNEKIKEEVFRLKTSSKTQVASPSG
jgi:outer membrane lipoprotein-sorting protein